MNLTVTFSVKVILENLSRGDDYECPFARTSIALTKMLCEVLEINGDARKLKTRFRLLGNDYLHSTAETVVVTRQPSRIKWLRRRLSIIDPT